jgi:uncharacterized protein
MKVMVAIGGHSFDRPAFEALLSSLPNAVYEIVRHPEAAQRMNPADMREFDALLLYDLPGIDFRERNTGPRVLQPSPHFTEGFSSLIANGIGIVALHHALAGWPAWPTYAEILGGTFLYGRATVRGRDCADSAFAADVDYDACVVVPTHPIVAGLPDRFALRDELYSCEIFESEIETLLHADHRLDNSHFQSSAAALTGAAGAPSSGELAARSRTIGWTRLVGNSRIAYIQPGDSAQTLANPHYRRLVANALRWTVS